MNIPAKQAQDKTTATTSDKDKDKEEERKKQIEFSKMMGASQVIIDERPYVDEETDKQRMKELQSHFKNMGNKEVEIIEADEKLPQQQQQQSNQIIFPEDVGADYDLKDLKKYSKSKFIKIVKYYHDAQMKSLQGAFKSDKRIQDLLKENEQLKEENTKLKARVTELENK